MNIKEYKGKLVKHLSDFCFTVTGGIKKNGAWYLKDDKDNFYPVTDCLLIEFDQVEFDIRKLKDIKTLHELEVFYEARIHQPGRFALAWEGLEKDPVNAASVAIFYCHDWQSFCDMCEAYEVSKEKSSKLNQEFRKRLTDKGLDAVIKDWYNATKTT